jgi:hemolysin III
MNAAEFTHPGQAMPQQPRLQYYSATEERINIASHALGLLFSVVALLALVTRALRHGDVWHLVSFSVYGLSLIALYAASTAYHRSREPARRARRRTVDHASIYLLIAGTYTPFALVTLSGPVGWTIFGLTWGMAASGIVLKLFYTGHYNHLSTLMYVLMGWLMIFFVEPLIERFPPGGLAWLLAGGIAYTAGTAFYLRPHARWSHAIWHLFVILGSLCHYVAVVRHLL